MTERPLPDELVRALEEGKASLAAHRRGELVLPTRQKIWAAMGPVVITFPEERQRVPPRRGRRGGRLLEPLAIDHLQLRLMPIRIPATMSRRRPSSSPPGDPLHHGVPGKARDGHRRRRREAIDEARAGRCRCRCPPSPSTPLRTNSGRQQARRTRPTRKHPVLRLAMAS
jgi:hypothetical protein